MDFAPQPPFGRHGVCHQPQPGLPASSAAWLLHAPRAQRDGTIVPQRAPSIPGLAGKGKSDNYSRRRGLAGRAACSRISFSLRWKFDGRIFAKPCLPSRRRGTEDCRADSASSILGGIGFCWPSPPPGRATLSHDTDDDCWLLQDYHHRSGGRVDGPYASHRSATVTHTDNTNPHVSTMHHTGCGVRRLIGASAPRWPPDRHLRTLLTPRLACLAPCGAAASIGFPAAASPGGPAVRSAPLIRN